jgi:hypothetical protein
MSYTSLGTAPAPDTQEHGKIVASNGWSYQLTADDILWLARSVDFEGGSSPAGVIWTYAQRYAIPNIHRLYPTFASLVRAHSQPVNPKWARDGALCRPGGPYAGKPECSEAKLARRDRAQSIPWDEIGPRVRDLVTQFSHAQLDNPVPRSVEFAAASLSARYLSNYPTARLVLKAGNWFIATAQSLLWPENHVSVHFNGAQSRDGGASGGAGGGISGGISGGMIAFAVFAAAAGLYVWRSRS